MFPDQPKSKPKDKIATPNYYRSGLLITLAAFFFVFPWIKMDAVNFPLTYQFFYLDWFAVIYSILLAVGFFLGYLPVPRSAILTAASSLLLVRVLSSFGAIVPGRPWFGAYSIWSDGIFYMAALLIVVVAILSLKPSQKEIAVFLKLLILQAIALSWDTISEAFKQGAFHQVARPTSPMLNSNYFISYVLLLWPVGIAMLIIAWRYTKDWLQVAYNGIFLIMAGLALILCLPPPLQQKVMPWLKEPLSTTPVTPAPTSTGFINDPSNSERFTQWKLGYEIGREHLWLGSGAGTTRAAFYQHINELPNWDYNVAMDHPHSDAIEQFADYGLIGLGAYLFFWGFLFYRFFKKQSGLEKPQRIMAFALATGLFLFILFNQVTFTVIHTGLVTIALIALLILYLNDVKFYPVKKLSMGVKTAIAIILIPCLIGGYWLLRYQAAEYWSVAALRAAGVSNYATASDDGQKAISYIPFDPNYYRVSCVYFMYKALFTPESLSEKQADSELAVSIAEKGAKLNPFEPDFTINLGIINLLLSAKDSDQERKGSDLIIKGVLMGKYNYKYYFSALNAYTFKDDYPMGKKALTELFSQAPAMLQPGLAEKMALYDAKYK